MNIVTAKANLSFMINEIKGEKTDIKQIRRCEIESLEFAISALEKQIPKKPIEYEDKYYACPICQNPLLYKWERYSTKLRKKSDGLPYCLGCGQAIDWSEEK